MTAKNMASDAVIIMSSLIMFMSNTTSQCTHFELKCLLILWFSNSDRLWYSMPQLSPWYWV